MMRDAYAPFADSGSSSTHAPAGSSRGGPAQVLWRQRVVILGCLALALLLIGTYLLLATPMYRSQARLFVQAAGAGGGPGQPLANQGDATHPPGPAGAVNPYREAEVLTSTPILATTLGDASIQELPTFADIDNRFDYLKSHLSVEVGTKDELITVAFTGPVAEDAAKVVESIVHSYTTFQTKKNRTTTDHVLEALTTERKGLEESQAKKRAELDGYSRQHGILAAGTKDGGASGDVQIERVRFLSAALSTAQVEALNAKNNYEQAVRPIADDPEKMRAVAEVQAARGMTPVTPEDEATLRNQLFQTQAKLEDMRQQYLPNHRIVRTLERNVYQLSIAYVAAMDRRWHAAQKKEADLRAAFEAQQKVASDRSADFVGYARLEQDLQNKQQQIAAVDKQIRDMNLLEAAQAAVDVQVPDPARVPERPAVPDKTTVIPIGLAIGLLAGVSCAFVRDRLDPRLRSTEEVKAVLGIPILATLPRMAENLAPAVRGQKVLLDPTSDVAEAYRTLRTAINFGVAEGHAKTILIASPSTGDGKTTVASNLAIGLAQGGKRVLLLDADLRQPGQHETFGIENHSGLVDVLAHELSASEVVHKTVVPNLELIPAGPSPENPADLLNSSRFMELMDDLTDRYDHVVIDSPPVLAATDARVIAASCDITMLVLRADRADRRQSEAAREGLLSVGANLLGLVMNYAAPGTQGYPEAGGHRSSDSNNGGGGGRKRSTAHASSESQDEQGDDATPLVALDAMKSLGKRPNQISR